MSLIMREQAINDLHFEVEENLYEVYHDFQVKQYLVD
jgi:hypothetical protein